jgi:hypothetical protein
MENDKNTYILDNDQPTTCPKCGARTDFYEIDNKDEPIQEHYCMQVACSYTFWGVFESVV